MAIGWRPNANTSVSPPALCAARIAMAAADSSTGMIDPHGTHAPHHIHRTFVEHVHQRAGDESSPPPEPAMPRGHLFRSAGRRRNNPVRFAASRSLAISAGVENTTCLPPRRSRSASFGNIILDTRAAVWRTPLRRYTRTPPAPRRPGARKNPEAFFAGPMEQQRPHAQLGARRHRALIESFMACTPF